MFFAYFLGVIFLPIVTFRKLGADKHRLRCGACAIMLVASTYAVSVLIGYLNGFYPQYPVPTLTPFGSPTPQREYYLWASMTRRSVFVSIIFNLGLRISV